MNLGHWVGLDNFSQISTWIDLLIAHIIVFGLNRPGGVELERARLKNSCPPRTPRISAPFLDPRPPFSATRRLRMFKVQQQLGGEKQEKRCQLLHLSRETSCPSRDVSPCERGLHGYFRNKCMCGVHSPRGLIVGDMDYGTRTMGMWSKRRRERRSKKKAARKSECHHIICLSHLSRRGGVFDSRFGSGLHISSAPPPTSKQQVVFIRERKTQTIIHKLTAASEEWRQKLFSE